MALLYYNVVDTINGYANGYANVYSKIYAGSLLILNFLYKCTSYPIHIKTSTLFANRAIYANGAAY